ncbi:microcystin-dependent protein [Flavobacterium sp. 270]|uniref:phage tail protein n=1 Tax=Flavobacterium sp. 270 TaxID=2512114 RepID=UPI0010D72108|nr:tail fiber protein [Flavobacterium sp. 270]TDW51782.1 microcystin-dependent protein [Flavobacterium sp. 270]
MEGTIGEIRLIAANFAPRSWSYCNGALLQIRSNTALFSILGTTYGGNGSVTFGLPDLRGRTVIGQGQGPGLSLYILGETVGTNSVTLNSTNIPSHVHLAAGTVTLPAYSDEGDKNTPAGNTLAAKATMYTAEAGDSNLKPAIFTGNLGPSGTNVTPLSLSQPTLGMNYIICLTGIFPARN